MNVWWFVGLLGLVPFYSILKGLGVPPDVAIYGLPVQFAFVGVAIWNAIRVFRGKA